MQEKNMDAAATLEMEAVRHDIRRREFIDAVTHAANYSSIDSFCDMRDYLIAEYLWSCVEALSKAVRTENEKRAA